MSQPEHQHTLTATHVLLTVVASGGLQAQPILVWHTTVLSQQHVHT